MTGRALPLRTWTAVFTLGGVLTTAGVSAAVLQSAHLLARSVLPALALGALAGLAVGLGGVVLAGQVASALHAMRDEAVHRLQSPSAPLHREVGRPLVARVSAELAELAAVLEALHLRVRLGDQVGERHRVEAETAGAGVFELLSDLVAAEEGARGQLAAELHDTVAQSLMIARGLLAAGLPSAGDFARLRDYVEDAEEQVRAVMARTRPPALRDGDLATAVHNLTLDMRARYGLRVDVVWPAAPYPLPLASAVTVYRFFQEALLNVVKHADVDTAVAELVVEAGVIRASVRDSGPGFVPAMVRPDRGRHVGLGLLSERARLSGGGLEVDSVVGAGTTLTLVLPRPAGHATVEARLPELLLAG